MEIEAEITCPFCGESYTIPIDTSVSPQRWVTDCEICCRPFEVIVDCRPGEILKLQVATS